MKPIANDRGEFLSDLIQQSLRRRIRVAPRVREHRRSHVAPYPALGIDSVGLTTRDRLPHPSGLAELNASDPTELLEGAVRHDMSVREDRPLRDAERTHRRNTGATGQHLGRRRREHHLTGFVQMSPLTPIERHPARGAAYPVSNNLPSSVLSLSVRVPILMVVDNRGVPSA